MLGWYQLSKLAAAGHQPLVADIHHVLEVAEKVSSTDGEEAPGEPLVVGVEKFILFSTRE